MDLLLLNFFVLSELNMATLYICFHLHIVLYIYLDDCMESPVTYSVLKWQSSLVSNLQFDKQADRASGVARLLCVTIREAPSPMALCIWQASTLHFSLCMFGIRKFCMVHGIHPEHNSIFLIDAGAWRVLKSHDVDDIKVHTICTLGHDTKRARIVIIYIHLASQVGW